MKKLGMITAVSALGVFAVLDLIRSFVVDDPIGYFRQEPSGLLYVAGIAVLGGLVVGGFYNLSARARRQAQIVGLGAVASGATAAVGYFVFLFFSLASTVFKHGVSFWSPLSMFLPVLFILLAVATCCWIACWRVWRKRTSP